MRLHSHGDRYAVYDDALAPSEFDVLRAIANERAIRPTLSAINRFHDGLSFQGSGPSGTLDNPSEGADGAIAATLAARCVQTLTDDNSASPLKGWSFASTYTAYPTGTQLSWHDDGAGRTGAFIYYLADWSGDWGGELDLIDCAADRIPRRNTLADSITEAPINVTSIFPRGNRLVVLAARTIHRVRRIDPLAGSAVRHALSGFVTLAQSTEGN